MKECIICKEVKDTSEYYAHPQMADGHLGKCKECCKSQAILNRKNNIERYREHDRIRNSTPERKKRRLSIIAKQRKEGDIKRVARDKLNKAVVHGKVIRPNNCENCGNTCTLHGHHEDYNEPLNVKWLCQKCHIGVHCGSVS